MEHPFLAALKREGDRLNAGRETYIDGPKIFHHMGHEREAAFPWLTDVQIAGEVRMLMRDNPMHEAIVCAGRDRILHLSEEVARLRILLLTANRYVEGYAENENNHPQARDGALDLSRQIKEAT